MTEFDPELEQQLALTPEHDSGGAIGWLREAGRTLIFLPARWTHLRTTPWLIAAAVLVSCLLNIGVQRAVIVGAADFYWRAIGAGWFGTAWVAWLCYLLRPWPLQPANERIAPSASVLLTLLLIQGALFSIAIAPLYIALAYFQQPAYRLLGTSGVLAVSLLPLLWTTVAELLMLARSTERRLLAWTLTLVLSIGATALYFALGGYQYWTPRTPASTEQNNEPEFHLTQQRMEAQPLLLAKNLAALQPQRPGVVDLYAISFAPSDVAGVFQREAAMVTDVMTRRFDAANRTLQLVNSAQTLDRFPWATPLNLQRAIQKIATLMDRDEDILFVHLTSHGASNGELAASFWPMEVDSVTPALLKTWLDQAGIKHRVISISACYSGSWIAPLANPDTLIVTAADASHTSYGCGKKSELTFFGKAMFDEQLRSRTRSFEQAYAAAVPIIKQREIEAGKDDGFSNPQIRVGAAIRERLQKLEQRLR